jgi:ubiquinone/menaquinone biosynthesis C-methylase UbiE
MKKTDYEDVAERYDDNEDRKRIEPDEMLAELVRGSAPGVNVLDLGCGTGNWLAVQTRHFAGFGVRWRGLDPSPAMLRRAETKVHDVELAVGQAEALPFADGSIDYLVTTFAFHHFEDKPRALDEMARVLSPVGRIRIVNIAPSYMPDWWAYRFFPAARAADEERFWRPERFFDELERRGFEPMLRIRYQKSYAPLRSLVADVERREISELAILPDDAYAAGRDVLRARLEADPNERGVSEIAFLDVAAWRTEHRATRWI